MLVLSFIILGENIKKLVFLLNQKYSCLYVTKENAIMIFHVFIKLYLFFKTPLLVWE